VSLAKTAEPIKIPFGLWTRVQAEEGTIRRWCTLAQPGEYNWTVCVQRRCGLMSNMTEFV